MATADYPQQYDIDSDPVFQQGLNSIMGPLLARGASQEEINQVTERANKTATSSTNEDPSNSSASAPSALSPSSEPALHRSPDDSPAPTTSSSDQPPYPLSFAALANLIATGAPIPGIRDIPDKLAEGEPSESTVDVKNVKKPWEKSAEAAEVAISVKEVAGEGKDVTESS